MNFHDHSNLDLVEIVDESHQLIIVHRQASPVNLVLPHNHFRGEVAQDGLAVRWLFQGIVPFPERLPEFRIVLELQFAVAFILLHILLP